LKRPLRLVYFAVALALSVLAHALTLSGQWISLPETPHEPPPLLARLERAPPPKIVPPPPPPKVAPVRAPRTAARAAVPRITVPQPPRTLRTPPTPRTPNPFTLPMEPEYEQDEFITAVPGDFPETTAPEPVVMADAAPSSQAIEPEVLRSLPRRGHIAFTLQLGTDGFNVGRTVQSWEIDDNRYHIESLSETTGLVAVFRGDKRFYRSVGRVTSKGLEPIAALSRRTRGGQTRESPTSFKWAQGTITLGNAPNQRTAPLPAGSQDVLSFIYQLSLAPPPTGRMQLAIANGSRFENHEFEVAELEIIKTPIGNLSVLPVRQIRKDGMESIEVWLAAEYRYLPVRIRFIGRDGDPTGEQLVTEIRISTE
jgi:hypothetical protein